MKIKLFLAILIAAMVIIIIIFVQFNKKNQSNQVSNLNTPSPEMVIKVQNSIQSGFEFIINTNQLFEGAATAPLFLLNKECNNPNITKIINNRLEEDIGQWPYMYGLYDPAYEYPIEKIKTISPINSRLLADAFYCKKIDFDSILADIALIDPENEYAPTHLLLSLSIMRDNECYNITKLNKQIYDLTLEMSITTSKSALEPCEAKDASLDIFAERVAVLGYAGYPIKSIWIDKLLNCQDVSGSWSDNTHTTSLSLWALAQYIDWCFNNQYITFYNDK